jgi:hypothetical protein
MCDMENRNFYRSTTIQLQGISSPEAFEGLLRHFTTDLRLFFLEMPGHDHELWSMYERIEDIIEQEEATEAEVVDAMMGEMQEYFVKQEFTDGGMKLYMESNFHADNDSNFFVDALAAFLMPYHSKPYLLLWDTHEEEGDSSINTPDILFRKGDQIFKVGIVEMIMRLFSNPDAALEALCAEPAIGQPVEQISDPSNWSHQRPAAA